jgi:hypothetical protein
VRWLPLLIDAALKRGLIASVTHILHRQNRNMERRPKIKPEWADL